MFKFQTTEQLYNHKNYNNENRILEQFWGLSDREDGVSFCFALLDNSLSCA